MSLIAIASLLLLNTQSDNLAPNPHFRLGGATADGWTSIYHVAGQLTATRDTKTFLHAPAALALNGLDEQADGNGSAELPDVSGKKLQIDGSVRCAGAIAEAQVDLFLQDENYKQIAFSPLVQRWGFKDGEWTPFHVTTEVPPNGKHARLILLIKGKGTVWLGEISVTAAGVSAPPTQDPLAKPKVAPLPRNADSPKLVAVSAVAPNVLELEFHAGRITPAKLIPYQPQASDQRIPKGSIEILKRNNEEIGWLIGVNHDHLVTYEHLIGDPLQTEYANWLGNFQISSKADPNFAKPVKPENLFRKSKPDDWEQPQKRFTMTHRIYLQLSHPLVPGKDYTVDFGSLNVTESAKSFTFSPSRQTTEAVHISQVGYRPDDPFKRAYLSCWRGTGGNQDYQLPLKFHVIDTQSGTSVFNGPVRLGRLSSEPEHMVREENFVKADVYWMDFSSLSKPGSYRVVVDGIGCSFDFPIAADVWDKAFKLQMRGLVNERSGIELKPPFADFVRPADMMPNPGELVTESTFSALNGQENFAGLVKGDTGKKVSGAWGGYHDAGDWNPRRATHLAVTRAHLEMLEMFPDHFRSFHVGLPDSSRLPDLLQEALWEVDLFRRLQKPDGGVPFGLETNGDPEDGDVSFLTTAHIYEFAPDCYASWTYAAAAAKVARLMALYNPAKLNLYKSSAVNAMEWAEKHYAEEKSLLSWDKIDARNLAAVEVYWLTKDPKWHAVYLENSVLQSSHPRLFQWGKTVQRDSAFIYACLPNGLGNPTYKQNAKDALEDNAKQCLKYAEGNAFNLTTYDKGRPLFVGFYSIADVNDLCRAHYFTHKPEYLAGIVRACQFSTGANPTNLAFTSGLGVNPIQHPLLLDSRRTGQPAPKGLTVFGPMDFITFHDDGAIWPIKYFLNEACIPPATQWPIPEAYWDIYLYPMINEFTVDTWAGNLYAWGYLAARK